MSQDGIGVVLDTGSYNTKAGFATEAFPRAIYPSAVARFRHQGLFDGYPIVCSGKEAIAQRGLCNLTWPIQEGLITNWEEMEKFWHHTFYKELLVPPEEARVMHAVHPLVSISDKEKIAEILFESFNVNGLYLMKTPVLVLHASGRTSGVVWESGFSCSYMAPVFEGFPLKHATILSPLTGDLITHRLQELLAKTGYSFTTSVEKELLNIIKTTQCYVARNYENEISAGMCSGENKVSYVLPDGQQILLGNERFQSTETLFTPSLAGLKCQSVVEDIISCISKCDIDYKTMFYDNIVIAGGSTMFPGLVDRLVMEITNVARKKELKAKVDAMESRHIAAWMGGSIIASLDCLKGFWLNRQDYGDGGSDRVKYKFF